VLGSRTSEDALYALREAWREGEKLRLLFFLFYHSLQVKQRTRKGEKIFLLGIGSLSSECKPTASLVAFRDLRGLGGLKNKKQKQKNISSHELIFLVQVANHQFVTFFPSLDNHNELPCPNLSAKLSARKKSDTSLEKGSRRCV
jgi:hypothetical protein